MQAAGWGRAAEPGRGREVAPDWGRAREPGLASAEEWVPAVGLVVVAEPALVQVVAERVPVAPLNARRTPVSEMTRSV